MSVPYDVVICTRCGLEGASLSLYGYFVWQSPEEAEFHFDRELGFCRCCNSISAMERFIRIPTLLRGIDHYHAGFWRRRSLKKALSPFDPDHLLLSTALYDRKSFAVLLEVLSLDRRPVCLGCGTSDVVSIFPSRPKGKSAPSSNRGIRHDGCGGHFENRSSEGVWVALEPIKSTYDIHGRLKSRSHVGNLPHTGVRRVLERLFGI